MIFLTPMNQQQSKTTRCYVRSAPWWLGIFFLVTSAQSFARARVAWMTLIKPDGSVVQFEPDFLYAHIAIEIQGRWLHASPRKGVVIESRFELEKLGSIQEIWESGIEDPKYHLRVPKYLGKPFDYEFNWSDEKMYCAELLAKLLNIPAQPMHFDPKLWPAPYLKYEGLPGSSPKNLYTALKNRGYERVE